MRSFLLLAALCSSVLFAAPQLVRNIGLDGGQGFAPVVNADGTRAALYWATSAGNYELRMYDLHRGLVLWRKPLVRPGGLLRYLGPEDISPLAFSADGSRLYANIRPIDSETFQPDSTFALYAVETESGIAHRVQEMLRPSSSIAVWHGGNAELVSVVEGNNLHFISMNDAALRRMVSLQSVRTGPWFVAANPQRSAAAALAVVNASGEVQFFSRSLDKIHSADFRESVDIAQSGRVHAIGFSPDGKRLRLFGHHMRKSPFLISLKVETLTLETDRPVFTTESFYDRRAHTKDLGSGVRETPAFGGPFPGGAVFGKTSPVVLLGKAAMVSRHCGQLLVLDASRPSSQTLANEFASPAGDAAVGLSPDGRYAVVVRNFGFNPLHDGPMQLEVWNL